MIDYYTTTLIHLSLEDYHNQGLTSETTKEIIERITDPFSHSIHLRCHPQGINSNWNVETYAQSTWEVCKVIAIIEDHLDYELDLLGRREHVETD
jgi:hypothetical protein